MPLAGVALLKRYALERGWPGGYPNTNLNTGTFPGGRSTFSLKLMTPQTHDDYHMFYNMYKEGTGCLRQQNNIEWKTELSIEPVK